MPHRTIHHLIPLLAMGLALLSQYSGLDLWFAQLFYDQQHHLWPYQEHWLMQTVIHRGGRDFVIVFIVSTLLIFGLSFVVKSRRHLRGATGYILSVSLTCLVIISELKSHTHMYSPWDLSQFGGHYPHIRLFDHVTQNSPVGLAFPAGHAGGGYILLSLYFVLREYTHRYRYLLLGVAIVIGMTFGIAQQIRGAHMLSHDLTTIAICWLTCLVWAKLMLQRKQTSQVEIPDSFLSQR